MHNRNRLLLIAALLVATFLAPIAIAYEYWGPIYMRGYWCVQCDVWESEKVEDWGRDAFVPVDPNDLSKGFVFMGYYPLYQVWKGCYTC